MKQKIIGIGNALVDILTKVEDDKLLEKLNLPKGSMQIVDAQTSQYVSDAVSHLENTMASGGSAANTIHGLAKLGAKTGFIGHVGNDEIGKFFENDLKTAGVEPKMFHSNSPSGLARALVTTDCERTFATFLGAAIELSDKHLSQELFSGYNYLYIEGYLVANKSLMDASIDMAKTAGLKIVLDLASYNVVEENRQYLLDLIKNKIDIVFSNEEEAKTLTGLNPEESLDFIASQCEIAIVKIGKKGSLIKRGDKKVVVKPVLANAVDTTGAGDMYAAGFLFGLINGKSLEQCGKMGSLLASTVIEVIGAKIDEERWNKIYQIIEEI